LCYIGTRVAEKEQQQKKTREYVKKTPSIRLVVLFFSFFFFSFSLPPAITHRYSLTKRVVLHSHSVRRRKGCHFLLVFFPFFCTHARVYTHIHLIKILCLMVNLKEKSEPLDNSMTSIHATRHTNHILEKKGCSADHRR
jgi:hypothetical protein